jgi:hypothetical protein
MSDDASTPTPESTPIAAPVARPDDAPIADPAALPLVLTLGDVLRVLRVSPATWYRARRAGVPLVPEIAGLHNRFARASVLATVQRTTRIVRRRRQSARR